MPKFDENIEKHLVKQVIQFEVLGAEMNMDYSNQEFEEMISLLDAQRGQKEYDWMSDIRIPEFSSHMLTQSAIDVGQYFQTRDFVEVYLEDESEQAKRCSEASKELINRTLNRKNLHHYQKFVRGKAINNVVGRVYAKCWWEKDSKKGIIGYRSVFERQNVDLYGNPITSDIQIPLVEEKQEPVVGDILTKDQFNYDIWDQRNVFTDNSYVYSIQDKSFITFRGEATLSKLKSLEKSNQYFNLDLVEKMTPPEQTKFKSEASQKETDDIPIKEAEKPYDIYERYGKYWMVFDSDENDEPVIGTERPGYDNQGEILGNAEMRHALITIVESGSKQISIGFRMTPFIDANGNPYIPALRGLCYMHLTEDGGVGDGKYSKELQIAIDDTFNVSQDRTMLATLPTIAVNKFAAEDNSTLYWAPQHFLEVPDPSKDIKEFKFSSDITAALAQINLLTQKMQQVDSIQPPTLGQTGQASTTATAFSGAFKATGERAQYKSLTFENTFLCDLYWMIQQMTYRFASPETGFKLMGDKIFDFNPSLDYYYKPLSQSIEPEHSKFAKRKEWTTLLGYVAQIPHPNIVKMINYIFGEIVKLMGDEYQNFSDKFLNEAIPIEAKGQNVEQRNAAPVSNQNMIPMSTGEQGVRGTIAA